MWTNCGVKEADFGRRDWLGKDLLGGIMAENDLYTIYEAEEHVIK